MVGLVAGALQTLLGIGGGAVVVPSLVFFAGYAQKQAQAASLWFVVPTSLFASVLYTRGTGLDIRLNFVAALVAAAFVGAAIGMIFLKRIGQNRLKEIFGAALVVIAGIMVWRSLSGNLIAIQDNPALQYLVLTWTGLVAGFLSSLLGIGGGIVVVPTLVLLGAFDQKVAQGISLMYIVPAGLFSAILYWLHAGIVIDGAQVVLMITCGLVGGFAGWEFVSNVSSQTLRFIFALAIAVLGITVAWRALGETKREETGPDWII